MNPQSGQQANLLHSDRLRVVWTLVCLDSCLLSLSHRPTSVRDFVFGPQASYVHGNTGLVSFLDRGALVTSILQLWQDLPFCSQACL